MLKPQEFDQTISSSDASTSAWSAYQPQLDTAVKPTSVMAELVDLPISISQASFEASVVPDPGSTPATAYNVGTLTATPRVLTDSVTSTDIDYYKFTLSAASNFNLSMTGMSADADVQLFASNGTTQLNYSTRAGSADEAINHTLGAGTYYVKVYPYQGANTAYTLRLSATSPSPTSSPSNLLPTETNIGTLIGTRIFSDSVSNTDTADVYRFSLSATRNINLTLAGLGADADVRLIRDVNNNGIVDTGDELNRSQISGTPAEWISRSLGAGNYFVQVYQYSGNTNYYLSLSTGDWYSQNLSDPGIIGLGRQFAADGQLNRNDMMAILRDTKDGSVIDTTELTDLRKFVAGRRSLMPDYVFNLSNKIVNPYDPNIRSGIGNLVGNDAATKMENLIGKHFLGTYRPTAASGTTYRSASGSLFQNGISYQDIDQGSLGDCYYLAALAGTALRTPSTIQSMFTDNGDNTYTVRFYNNGVADYVTVDRYLPTDAAGKFVYANRDSGKLYNNTSNELWVALAEKAYAQMNEAGWTGHGTTNSYAAIANGWPDDAVRQITARNTVRDLSLTDSDRTAVINAFNNGRIVFLNWAAHALTLVGYNSTTQRFTIHNPWGHTDEFTWSEIINGKPGEERFTDWSYTTT
ncbi:MAG TPA: hypothetical protein DCY88_15250 [Cyanobacteria bacterium UBA11372]|nr:hypothetical protein [Cyanobacteria bacterium UBA11372]